MKTLNIFKAGTHTAANGQRLDFGEDLVRASASAYDPALHEAPIVVGHPRDNLPAYGWVQALQYNEETGLEAIPAQVDPDFEELVAKGRFKKISASFYLPTSPANPVPGTYYLRHVGFLGAQPPAVKGLRDAAFNDGDELVVEFMSAYDESTNAGLWRRLREWLIGEKGLDAADQVVPIYAVQDLEAGARSTLEQPTEAPASPAFSEPGAQTMTPEELKAAQDKLAADQAAFAEQQTAITAREEAVAARETAISEADQAARRKSNADFIEGLVSSGKVLPAQSAGLVAMLNSMDAGQPLEFGEGDAAVTTTDSAFFRSFLEAQPKVVDYTERAGDDQGEATDFSDPVEVAQAIETEQARVKRESGKDISAADAAQNLAKAKAK